MRCFDVEFNDIPDFEKRVGQDNAFCCRQKGQIAVILALDDSLVFGRIAPKYDTNHNSTQSCTLIFKFKKYSDVYCQVAPVRWFFVFIRGVIYANRINHDACWRQSWAKRNAFRICW